MKVGMHVIVGMQQEQVCGSSRYESRYAYRYETGVGMHVGMRKE